MKITLGTTVTDIGAAGSLSAGRVYRLQLRGARDFWLKTAVSAPGASEIESYTVLSRRTILVVVIPQSPEKLWFKSRDAGGYLVVRDVALSASGAPIT